MIKNFIAILTLFFCLHGQISIAQSESIIEVTSTYLFKNAMVVDKPGAIPMLQSVLVKNGIITEIAPSIKPPFDAKTIDVDSMYMYAGFIDPMSYTGIKKEEEKKEANKPTSRGQATLEQSGVTPQITALSKISIKESSLNDMRKAGFTTSHVFPRGKMMSGSSAIINLKETDNADKMIVAQNTALHSSFATANSAAPSTIIGVIAKFKDLYKNTDLAIKNMGTYNQNVSGIKKPIFSAEFNAMMPVSKKEMPVFFVTEKSKDIFRAISLQKEVGFKMVLADVKQSQFALNQIKAGGYTILLSMDLPDEIKEEVKKDDTKKEEIKKEEAKKEEGQKDDTKKEDSKKDIKPKKIMSAEETELEERKKISYAEYNKQASMLEKNNIPFSFSYLDVKTSDIHKLIKRMIKSGLSESAALAALTTTPAQILGISKTNGSIEIGKVANLVLTDKALFQDKAEIKYVMVDGSLYDYQEKKKSETKIDEKGAKIEGVWTYTVEVPGSVQTGKLTFEKEDSTMKGFSQNDSSPSETDKMDDITIDGDKVTFNMVVDMGQPTTVNFDLTFNGDNFSGTVTVGSIGTFPIKGSKTSGPK